MDTFIGIDLGQLTDFTAATVVCRSLAIDGAGSPERTARADFCYKFDVVGIRRYQLGTSYAAIVAHVVQRLERPELQRARLAVDATGVGVGVLEMFRGALRRRHGL